MISYTTLNRPEVLRYSLSKTREVYDGFIVCIDDHSDCADENKAICKELDVCYLYNDKRIGIPRSKERGFRCLLNCDYQIWLDDDCYIKPGFIERFSEAMEYYPHLLYMKPWAHIRPINELGHGVTEFNGATACMMMFAKRLYHHIHGFQVGYGKYGGWHHNLSINLVGQYLSLSDAPEYVHSFDLDGKPEGFEGKFGSSLTFDERHKK